MNNRQGSRQRPPPMVAAVATAVHRDSHAISKPMISKPKIKIWHVLPPEIIHTDAANFRDLVQRLTGFQHTTTKTNPTTTATPSPTPPTSSSPDHHEACSQRNNNNNTPMTPMAIKDELKQEEEEEQQQQQVERMFWMEESSLGFLRALEEDQNDHDHDQFFLHGFGDLHLLPFING